MSKVLLVSHRDDALETLASAFDQGSVRRVRSRAAALTDAKSSVAEMIFVEVSELIDSSTLAPARHIATIRESLRELWSAHRGAKVVVIGEPPEVRQIVRAVKAGAADYLTHPIDAVEIPLIRASITEHERINQELAYLRKRAWGDDALGSVREPTSAVMSEVIDKLARAADSNVTVLLTGETGTGKTMMARMLHRMSRRADRQFIAVHCGAIPESLLESELFGHEKGAFTGAVKRRLGKFELAHGGTLFLDEIGTMSLAMQIKLLQVLQDRTIHRVGGEKEVAVDVRVVAATNDDLKVEVDAKRFRSDLFFRLNVFPVRLPPLRDRRADIPELVDAFVERANRLQGRAVDGVHPEVIDALTTYAWPGNVRELESVIERACILESGNHLTAASLPAEVFANSALPEPLSSPLPSDSDAPLESLAVVRKRAAELAEHQYLVEQLRRHKGRIGSTAQAAGVTTRQLHKLMTRHGLRKEDFKAR